jgi:undecaprenyl diphosphate synthase
MSLNFERQSSLPPAPATPALLHVALVPDGNGRWATARGMPRSAGHRAGVDAVRRAVRAAPDLGIGTLTIHALSTDNWRRPLAEVLSILGLVAAFLDGEIETCRRHGVRLSVLGRRTRLPGDVLRSVERAERETADGARLHLRLALDYSSREAIAAAAAAVARSSPDVARDDLAAALAGDDPSGVPVPDVDLVVRTGGERRLGDFLLWESAYAELVFLRRPWPEFRGRDLAAAVAEFHRRERRFGGLPQVPAMPAGA